MFWGSFARVKIPSWIWWNLHEIYVVLIQWRCQLTWISFHEGIFANIKEFSWNLGSAYVVKISVDLRNHVTCKRFLSVWTMHLHIWHSRIFHHAHKIVRQVVRKENFAKNWFSCHVQKFSSSTETFNKKLYDFKAYFLCSPLCLTRLFVLD